MSSDETQRAEYRATVKEGADGAPFIMLEPAGAEAEWIRELMISLQLVDGTTPEDAQALAALFNRRVTAIGVTVGRPPIMDLTVRASRRGDQIEVTVASSQAETLLTAEAAIQQANDLAPDDPVAQALKRVVHAVAEEGQPAAMIVVRRPTN